MSKKKILVVGLVALILTATVASAALAASGIEMPAILDGPGDGPGGGRRGGGLRGEITAIGTDEFTLQPLDGDEITIAVDDETRYVGDLSSFTDLEVGMEVGVALPRDGEDQALAKAVVSGAQLDAARARGEVTDVNSDSLTIETRDGESLTFEVTADTEFHSRDDSVQSLSDISVGDFAMVIYEEDGSNLVALVIGSGTPQQDGDGLRGGFGPGNGQQEGFGPGNSQNG